MKIRTPNAEGQMKADAQSPRGWSVGHSSFAPGRSTGFTLMEVLLAVLVFAIVLAAIQSVFFAALKLQRSTTAAVEASLPLEHTLDVVKLDLSNLMMPTGGVFTGSLQSTPTTTALEGSGNNTGLGLPSVGATFGTLSSVAGNNMNSGPIFYTASAQINQWSPWSEVQRVSYYLAPSTNNAAGMDLIRVVERNLLPVADEEYSEQYLMSGVEQIGFQYYDGLEWLDTWDSTMQNSDNTNALPTAIKFSLQLAEQGTTRSTLAPVELVVPLSLQSVTNQTSDVTGGGG